MATIMMNQPPIDDLVEKAKCKYALVCLITKRARMLYDKRANLLEDSGVKAISYAAAEVYHNKVIMSEE